MATVTGRRARAGLASLADRVAGEVVGPEHPAYDTHRTIWNGSIDRRPAAILRCAEVGDVVAGIRAARELDLELAVRSGGHSFPGLSVVDDGMVVDLRGLAGVAVDASAGVARVGAGTLLGEMDAATQGVGAAVPTGAVTHTGVAGLTLGGGIGWLMRRHGLAVDRLRAVELVTVDGEVLRVSGEEHPELFWGLRGGGGNFGVATSFEFALDPVGPVVVSGMVLWALEDAMEVGAAYRAWADAAPRELTSALVMRPAPAGDLVPEALRGRLVVGVLGCWSGDLDAGEAYWASMRSFGRPLLDLSGRRPYLDHQSMLDASYPHGVWVHMKACDVGDLDDDVLRVCADHASGIASPRSGVIAWQLGGAVADPPEDTAVSSRGAGWILNISGITDGPEGFPAERDWVRRFWEAVLPHQTSVYVNFLMDADVDRVRAAYGAERFDRLQALKRAHDPDNVLHLNQNVPPA